MHMHVGKSVFFQNPDEDRSDSALYKHEIALAEQAEPLGFESFWIAEHHFGGYDVSPNTLQLLTYLAAKTKHVRLGSSVVVLPWHDPLRVAEELSVLDHLSNGRLLFGIGRGKASSTPSTPESSSPTVNSGSSRLCNFDHSRWLRCATAHTHPRCRLNRWTLSLTSVQASW
jgi:hypothetical protein